MKSTKIARVSCDVLCRRRSHVEPSKSHSKCTRSLVASRRGSDLGKLVIRAGELFARWRRSRPLGAGERSFGFGRRPAGGCTDAGARSPANPNSDQSRPASLQRPRATSGERASRRMRAESRARHTCDERKPNKSL